MKMNTVEPLPKDQEMNLDHEYWVTKFLYPFALDTAPLKPSDYPVEGPTLGGPGSDQMQQKPRAGEKFNILDTTRFNFPLSHLDHKEEYLADIINPITVQKDDIVKHMYKYQREFRPEVIPHITEAGEIVDIIHNYKRPKMANNDKRKAGTGGADNSKAVGADSSANRKKTAAAGHQDDDDMGLQQNARDDNRHGSDGPSEE